MWWMTCPDLTCKHHAPLDDFEPSLSDEATCPKCGVFFQFSLPCDEDDED